MRRPATRLTLTARLISASLLAGCAPGLPAAAPPATVPPAPTQLQAGLATQTPLAATPPHASAPTLEAAPERP